ncbi:MAG TPA: hypothetical protein VFD92_19640 [Candidatus Binatia bacterium]|nr:hypothetical protein [Candidatus Binatia bacterium]
MKRFGILNIVLVALIALAAWRTIGVWRRDVPDRPPAPDSGPRPATDLPPAPRTPPIPQLVSVIADKDLFDQSRKAAEEAAPAPVATPAPPPPTLKLAGVIVVGTEREALLIDTAQANKQFHMREGEEISGYKVGRIGTEQISLIGPGGEETTVQMIIDKAAAKKGFGPGGKPSAAAAAPGGGGPLRPQGPPPGAPQPMAPAQQRAAAGAIAPADPSLDARQRAESARERLKRLRAEAARQ